METGRAGPRPRQVSFTLYVSRGIAQRFSNTARLFVMIGQNVRELQSLLMYTGTREAVYVSCMMPANPHGQRMTTMMDTARYWPRPSYPPMGYTIPAMSHVRGRPLRLTEIMEFRGPSAKRRWARNAPTYTHGVMLRITEALFLL